MRRWAWETAAKPSGELDQPGLTSSSSGDSAIPSVHAITCGDWNGYEPSENTSST